MFTGIISKTSKVKSRKLSKSGLNLEVYNNLGKLKKGESIAVNGVCSTIKGVGKNISFEYMPETLKLSNLSFLKKEDIVNVEKSMRLNDRLHGHIVLGHVDGRGKILGIKTEGNSKVFDIKLPDKEFKKFLVYKGSVAVEGISLTVAKVLKDSFVIKVIPHTLKHTNLKYKTKGDLVNLEFDITAKYLSRTKFLSKINNH
ncbi:riboflavin synthase [Candidatus Nomurabacteria bacterium]|nr:riboflavin synthase [Candidatus Nomurabacteria bacterium]